MNKPAFTLEKHQPERRRKPTDVTLHCGCTCCCCCCLHTIGGIIGAGVAPALGRKDRMPLAYYYDDEDDWAPLLRRSSGPSAVALSWWILLGICVAGLFLGAGATAATHGDPGAILIGLVILAMVFPAVHFFAILITFIVVGVMPRADKSYQFRQLGKMILGLVVGTVLGILVMVVFGFALAYK